MVVLVTAMRQGPSPRGYTVLQKRFGVDRRTIGRWQLWWKDAFPLSKFWAGARARSVALPGAIEFPRTLVDLFQATSGGRMAALLRFLSPLSGSSRFEFQVF
jgi:hypothetical protein